MVGPNQGLGCGSWILSLPQHREHIGLHKKSGAEGLVRTRTGEPGSARVNAEQACPQLGGVGGNTGCHHHPPGGRDVS